MQKQCHLCESTNIRARGLCPTHYQRLWQRMWRAPDTSDGWPYEGPYRKRGLKCEYCHRSAHARGLCNIHYCRLRRRGMLEVRISEGVTQ